MSNFDSTKTRLEELLQDIKKGKTQLPDFQRGWVWMTTIFAACW